MDKEYFLNTGIQPPSHFDPSPAMMWPSLPSVPEMNCSPEQSLDCFLNPDWDNSNSALSSIVSSCYTTPSNSPPKLNSPIKTPFLKSNIPNLQAVSADPGFAERAAKLSCFGSRSFNGRTSQSGLNTTELPPYGLSPFVGSVKLARVSSSPSLKAVGSPMGVQENKNFTKTQMEIRPKDGLNAKFRELVGYDASNRPEFASPNEGSSVSGQIPNGEIEVKTPSDSNFRKRKSTSRGKSKEIVQTHSPNSRKAVDVEDYLNAKRCKSTESNGIENGSVKTEEEKDKGQKQDKADLKPAEPPKDYIHVRARRGQATDSHSLAERVRREKISERMKLLQDLVPGCNKVTGKALMLDEIINYVQSLQRQVELLSMKLASVNTDMDFDMGSLLSKDAPHPKGCMPHSTNPLNPLASPFFGQLKQEIPPTKTSFLNRAIAHCSVDPSDTTMCGEISMQLPFVDEVGQGFPQFSASFEDDLQSIVQMGFGQNPNNKPGLHSQSLPGSGETSHMKIEL